MQHQQRAAQLRDGLPGVMRLEVVDKRTANGQRGSAEIDLSLAVADNVVELVAEQLRDMGDIERCSDGRDRGDVGNCAAAASTAAPPRLWPIISIGCIPRDAM